MGGVWRRGKTSNFLNYSNAFGINGEWISNMVHISFEIYKRMRLNNLGYESIFFSLNLFFLIYLQTVILNLVIR